MSEFRLVICTDNAAFDGDNHGPELARIMRMAAQHLEDAGGVPNGIYCGDILDSNGNRCGYYAADMRDEE